jgi:hypothetical protein
LLSVGVLQGQVPFFLMQMKRGAVFCVKYCGTIVKENNYSIKCKIPLNFVFKKMQSGIKRKINSGFAYLKYLHGRL